MRRPSAVALAAVFTFGNAFAAGRSPDAAPPDPGPGDDLVATACSSGLLVRPNSADDPKGDGGAGFQAQAREDFPSLFGAGSDAKSDPAKTSAAASGGAPSGPAPAPTKTSLLRPSGDAAGCPEKVRGFYARYGTQVNAIPSPSLEAAQIRGGVDQLYDRLNAGPARAVPLTSLSGDDLKQKRAALASIFDGSKTLGDAFGALERNAQAVAARKAAAVLIPAPVAPSDGQTAAAVVTGGRSGSAARGASSSAGGAAVDPGQNGPMSPEQRRHLAANAPVPAAPSGPMPYARNWANKYLPMEAYSRVVGGATAAVNSAVHGVFGGGDPSITEEMTADPSSPPAWRMMRAGRWGTKAFVEGLRTVCRTLQAKGLGRPLEIGDISNKYGGPIRGHVSHRAGKDVDVYFVTDAKGRFDPVWNMRVAGVAVGTYAKVTHIFVDQRLKNLMESVYRANPDAVPADERANVQKALQLMSHWPHHDTHFHIRTDYNVHPGDEID